MNVYVSSLFALICSLSTLNVVAKYDTKADTELIDNEIPCGVANAKKTSIDRIVGGEKAAPHEFPWMVSIQVKIEGKFQHDCGGAIVHPEFILTAGHCVAQVSAGSMKIVAGVNNLKNEKSTKQERNIKKIFNNLYNPANYANDTALIQMDKRLDYMQESVAPICLPRGHETFYDTTIAAGWGRLSENGLKTNDLMKVELPILEIEDCKYIFEMHGKTKYMHEGQICTLDFENYKDACQGDSGGPLMCSNKNEDYLYVCGIVSFGLGCARKYVPGVYSNVTYFAPWIMKTIHDNENK